MYPKIIAAVAAVVALATTGLLLLSPGDGPDRKLLAHVPAETVFYGGYTDPTLPLAEVVDMWGPLGRISGAAQDTLDPAAAADKGGPGAGMLAGIYQAYLAGLADDEHPLARFGVGPKNVGAVYAVGALPVLRISIDEAQAFWQGVGAIEDKAGVDGASEPLTQGKRRHYPFQTGSDQGELDLVVAANNGYAIVTLAGSGIDEAGVAMALGESQPERSLRDSGRVDALAERHGTLPTATGFIDQKALAAGLTGASDKRFGDMLTRILEAWAGDTPALATIRNPACQQDLVAIAEHWPYTSFGITRLDTNTRELGTRTSMAIPEKGLRSQLTGLRGRIPEPVEDRPIAGLGLGLNAATLATTLQDLASAFTGSDFQCPPVQNAQRTVASQPLNRLGMTTAMISDVRGISAALTGLGGGQAGGLPFQGDAVIEIATAKPKALWQFAQQSLGLPVDKRPEAGGDPVRIKMPMLGDLSLRAAIRENALLALTGDAKLDSAAGESATEPNGILNLRYDYGRMASALISRMPGDSESLPGPEALAGIDAYYDMRLDTDDHGLRFDTSVAPAPQD